MSASARAIEGVWEEIQSQTKRLAGKRVRVTILSSGKKHRGAAKSSRRKKECTLSELAGAAPGWAGDDFEDCLRAVYESRLGLK